jgi:nucleotide-sensitive chloride channel 1A
MNAQDGRDILLELNLSDADTADEDIQCLSLRIHASKIENNVSAADHLGATANGTTSHNDVAAALFQAISDCQELNPDPPGPGDEGEDGVPAFDETAPGATGWITSENMADFMDEDGNFRIPEGVTVIGDEESGPQTLGEGAGRTRTAAEAEVGNEAADDADETKWQRTE